MSLGDALSDVIRELGPIAWVLVAACAACVTSVVVATVRTWRSEAVDPLGAFALPLGLLGLTLAAGGYRVTQARVGYLAALLHPSQGKDAIVAIAAGASGQMNGVLATSTLATIEVIALLVGLGLASRRGPRAHATLLLPLTSSLVLLAGALRATFLYMSNLLRGFASVAAADPAQKARMLYDTIVEAQGELAGRATHLAALGAIFLLCSLLWAARDARHGRLVTSRQSIVSVGVLVAGLAAFAGTRGLAYDAARPPPPSPPMMPLAGETLAQVPERDGCKPLVEAGPVLTLDAGGAALDGGHLADPARLVDELTRLRNNYALLHPDGPPPAIGALLAVARDTPGRVVAPWLAAIASPGGTRTIGLVSARRRVLETRTLGTLEDRVACATLITLDPNAPPLPADERWDAFVRRAESASSFRVAP